MAKEDMSAPASSAGLVRYFNVSAGGIEVTPEIVVGVSVMFIMAVLLASFIM